MFPFHTLAFNLWFVMVDPCFISRDEPFPEAVTFSNTVVQSHLQMSERLSLFNSVTLSRTHRAQI